MIHLAATAHVLVRLLLTETSVGCCGYLCVQSGNAGNAGNTGNATVFTVTLCVPSLHPRKRGSRADGASEEVAPHLGRKHVERLSVRTLGARLGHRCARRATARGAAARGRAPRRAPGSQGSAARHRRGRGLGHALRNACSNCCSFCPLTQRGEKVVQKSSTRLNDAWRGTAGKGPQHS